MRVFCTVGTTKFEKLVECVDDSEVLRLLKQKGFGKVVIQYGKGAYEPKQREFEGIMVESYRFKPSLEEDFKAADLVISHAGYGCLIESLTLKKPVVAVINETLMANHQHEIAKELESRNLLVKCTPQTLFQTLKETDVSSFAPLEPARPEKFVQVLDEMLGF